MFGVPASKRYGRWFQVEPSKDTDRIMSPPPCQGGMAASTGFARVEHADAGRAVHLVRGERVEVAAERLHVDGHVRNRLGAVDHRRDPAVAGRGDEVRDRQHRAEGVGDVGEGDHARARAEQAEIGLEVDDAAPVDRHDAERGARLRGDELPGHDVRVMLEARDDDLVAGRRAAGARTTGRRG